VASAVWPGRGTDGAVVIALDVMDVDALRALTPGTGHRVHLNNAGAALLSSPTLQAMTSHLQLESEIGGYEAAATAQKSIDACYGGLANLINGNSAEIALLDSADRAWSAAFYSIPLGPGDRILTGRAEYGTNVLAYLQIARRTGAEVVIVPNDEFGQLDVEALAALVDERTKLIGVSHVPTSGGLINPAAQIGRIARAAGVIYLLDATQSVGQFPLDVEAIGCDLLTGTGRKFLRGPRGTGFLWARTSVLDRLDPYVVNIRAAGWDGDRSFRWADGARRFETWENSYVNIIGLGAAVEQALDLGLDAIGARTLALGARLREQLAALPGVSTHDLGRERCGIVTAKVDGVSADDVRSALARAAINVTTTVPEDTQFDTQDRGVHPLVRLSPHYYNTEAELDQAVSVIAQLAGARR
jgi:selenocysteine lyase/cysteine desulfurase